MASQQIGLNMLCDTSRIQVKSINTMGANKYEIYGDSGELIFRAKENASGLSVYLIGKDRSFVVNLFDTNHQQLISVRRPRMMGVGKVVISICGKPVSVVREKATFFSRSFNINYASDQTALKLKGFASEFQLLTLDKQQIGGVTRLWGGWWKEMFTHRNQYLVTFPRDLALEFKAACIGACFFMDLLYFKA